MNQSLVEFKNVSIKYLNHKVVTDLSFSIQKGEILTIIGPNGAGKTSTINALTSLIKPTSGEIIINTKNIAYVPQKMELKSNFPLTVKEFIYFGFPHQKIIIRNEDIELIKSWLSIMLLDDKILNQRLSSLSGGQIQRVFLIRALIQMPDLLILDEPTSALDSSFRKEFYQLITHLNISHQISIIQITHDINDTFYQNSTLLYLDNKTKFYGSYEKFLEYKKEINHE